MMTGMYDNYVQQQCTTTMYNNNVQQWTKGIELGLIVRKELFDVKHFNNIVEQNHSTDNLK